MKFDRSKGIWTGVINDILEKPKQEDEETDIPEPKMPEENNIKGSCVLSIRFESKYEYEKWRKYNPGRNWEFLVSYPAIMQATYAFSNSRDVEILAKKIVQILQSGFEVYSARWQLEEEK